MGKKGVGGGGGGMQKEGEEELREDIKAKTRS